MSDIKSKKEVEPIPNRVNDIADSTVDAALTVHSILGPGLLESVYESCLMYELQEKGLIVSNQTVVPVHYKNVYLDTGFRLDINVENSVIVEVKAVEKLAPIHEAQLLTYLKLTGLRVGYLINFNTPHLKDGIKRLAL